MKHYQWIGGHRVYQMRLGVAAMRIITQVRNGAIEETSSQLREEREDGIQYQAERVDKHDRSSSGKTTPIVSSEVGADNEDS